MYLKIKSIDNINNVPKNFNEPILFKNGCKSMKAIKSWNLNYIKDNMNNIFFPVEIYKNRDDMGSSKFKKQMSMKFNKIIDKIVKDQSPYHYCAEVDLHQFEDRINDLIFDDIEYEYDNDFIINGLIN